MNIYLHYVVDLWAQRWRKKRARGDVVVVRLADDFVVGCEHREEAEQYLAELRHRWQAKLRAPYPRNSLTAASSPARRSRPR